MIQGFSSFWLRLSSEEYWLNLIIVADRGDAEVFQVRGRDPDGAGRAEAGGGGEAEPAAGVQGEGSALQRQMNREEIDRFGKEGLSE